MPLRAHRRRGPVLDSRPAGPGQERRQHAAPTRRGLRPAGRNPEALTSDGGPNIARACSGAFRSPDLRRKAIHESYTRLAGDRNNNNNMESLNGVVKDREKVTRSIKRRDSPVIDGMRIRHNTKSCMGQGASRRATDRDDNQGDDKWVTLI